VEGVCGSCGINKFFGLCAALRPLTAPPATKAAPRTEAGHNPCGRRLFCGRARSKSGNQNGNSG
jgi:hypothetical protein